MKTGMFDAKEIIVRFVLGGAAVVLCYVISVFSPVKFIGGIFAAFPAVMGAAVMMAGLRDGDSEAADVARGAIAGMVGGTIAVIAALYLIKTLNSWIEGLAGSLIIWVIASIISNMFISGKASVKLEASDLPEGER